MPFSKNLNTYTDVEAILQACRKSGAVKCNYELETRGLAVNWRARAYYYRTLLRNLAKQRLSIPGYEPTTDWDDMVLELLPNSNTVTIRFGVNPLGELRIDGRAVDVAPVTPPAPITAKILETLAQEIESPDDLEREAQAMIERLGLDQ